MAKKNINKKAPSNLQNNIESEPSVSENNIAPNVANNLNQHKDEFKEPRKPSQYQRMKQQDPEYNKAQYQQNPEYFKKRRKAHSQKIRDFIDQMINWNLPAEHALGAKNKNNFIVDWSEEIKANKDGWQSAHPKIADHANEIEKLGDQIKRNRRIALNHHKKLKEKHNLQNNIESGLPINENNIAPNVVNNLNQHKDEFKKPRKPNWCQRAKQRDPEYNKAQYQQNPEYFKKRRKAHSQKIRDFIDQMINWNLPAEHALGAKNKNNFIVDWSEEIKANKDGWQSAHPKIADHANEIEKLGDQIKRNRRIALNHHKKLKEKHNLQNNTDSGLPINESNIAPNAANNLNQHKDEFKEPRKPNWYQRAKQRDPEYFKKRRKAQYQLMKEQDPETLKERRKAHSQKIRDFIDQMINWDLPAEHALGANDKNNFIVDWSEEIKANKDGWQSAHPKIADHANEIEKLGDQIKRNRRIALNHHKKLKEKHNLQNNTDSGLPINENNIASNVANNLNQHKDEFKEPRKPNWCQRAKQQDPEALKEYKKAQRQRKKQQDPEALKKRKKAYRQKTREKTRNFIDQMINWDLPAEHALGINYRRDLMVDWSEEIKANKDGWQNAHPKIADHANEIEKLGDKIKRDRRLTLNCHKKLKEKHSLQNNIELERAPSVSENNIASNVANNLNQHKDEFRKPLKPSWDQRKKQRDPEVVKEYRKRYYKANREAFKEYSARYHEANPEYNKRNYEANREAYKRSKQLTELVMKKYRLSKKRANDLIVKWSAAIEKNREELQLSNPEVAEHTNEIKEFGDRIKRDRQNKLAWRNKKITAEKLRKFEGMLQSNRNNLPEYGSNVALEFDDVRNNFLESDHLSNLSYGELPHLFIHHELQAKEVNFTLNDYGPPSRPSVMSCLPLNEAKFMAKNDVSYDLTYERHLKDDTISDVSHVDIINHGTVSNVSRGENGLNARAPAQDEASSYQLNFNTESNISRAESSKSFTSLLSRKRKSAKDEEKDRANNSGKSSKGGRGGR